MSIQYVCCINHIDNKELEIDVFSSIEEAQEWFKLNIDNASDIIDILTDWDSNGFDFKTDNYHVKMIKIVYNTLFLINGNTRFSIKGNL